MLRIRPLVADDQDMLWEWLHLSLWDPPPAPPRPRELLFDSRVRIYAEAWGRPGDLGVVGELDGEPAPIGACWMRLMAPGLGLAWVDAETPQLGIALHAGHRGQGHGRRLMEAALAAARAAGRRQAALTVHPQNPAIALYESCGFEKVGLRNTFHLMAARLAQADICPLCGAANGCAIARGDPPDRPCWCVAATFSAPLLERVPLEARGRACICAACAAGSPVTAAP